MIDQKEKPTTITRQRRGVGAIIGGVILAGILLTTVLLYFVTILNNDQRKELYNVQSSQIDQDKAAEKLTATATDVETNPAGLTGLYMKTLITNDGSLPLIVSHSAAYCITCPSPNNPSPTPSFTSIALNLKDSATVYVPVTPSEMYTAGFITERGNTFYSENCEIVSSDELACSDDSGGLGNPNFEVSAVADVFFLTAGTSGAESIVNVTSINGFNEQVTLSATWDSALTVTMNPATPVVTPDPDESVEAATLTIDVPSGVAEGDYFITVSGTNDDGTLKDSTTITVAVFSTDDESSTDEDAILKPQISAIFPSPFGATGSSSTSQGLFGVVVANPSDAPMHVRRVVVTAFPPTASNADVIFPKSAGSSCQGTAITMITPTTGWNCPEQNILQWSSTTSVTVNAHSSRAFLVAVGKNSGGNLPSLALNFNVFTDFGQYAKAGYAGSQQNPNTNPPTASVYLSSATQITPTTSTMIGTLSGTSGTPISVIANIANLGSTGSIASGGHLIVSIPKAFPTIGSTTTSAGIGPCTTTQFDDGSHQVSCPLTSALTAGQVRSVDFTITSQTVIEEKLYPLFVLADGLDSNGQPIGPVAENVVRVTPS